MYYAVFVWHNMYNNYVLCTASIVLAVLIKPKKKKNIHHILAMSDNWS